MADVNVHIDGQTIQLPEEVAKDDELIRKALAPFYPGAATATIERSSGKITVIKRAGPKGASETVTITGPAGSFTSRLTPFDLWDAACKALGAQNTSGVNLGSCSAWDDEEHVETHVKFEARLLDGSTLTCDPCLDCI
jgi:hypothetical protein